MGKVLYLPRRPIPQKRRSPLLELERSDYVGLTLAIFLAAFLGLYMAFYTPVG